MVLVGEPAPLCFDAFGGDGVPPPFMDAGGIAFGYEYRHSLLLEEDCLLGSRPWESLPTGVLGAEPSNANAFGHNDGWANAASVSSSSVLTFDGHAEQFCAAWMDSTNQVSSCLAAAAISFSFGDRGVDDDGTASAASQKRPRAHALSQHGTEKDTTTPKKQCGGNKKTATKANKTPTATTTATAPPKEPQSLAAKSRRERIGERLRALQELVPNGGKVDMVTMLDKAINYVKFMQLQLKVVETDAFWPAQGGKGPEISTVKEALDAIILSSLNQAHRSS